MKKQIEQGLNLRLKLMVRSSLLALLLFTSSALGSVRVAFQVIHKWNGEPWILEKGGRFTHIAIEVEGYGWLHAHPLRGVELISEAELQKIGFITEVLVMPRDPIQYKNIFKYLGKKYDSKFSWNGEAYYCSELVAKILRIQPGKMYFDPELWPEQYSILNGQKGISPDDLFSIISNKIINNENQLKTCGSLFKGTTF